MPDTQNTSVPRSQTSSQGFDVAQSLGVHPLVAAVLVALDFMLFSGEVASGGLLTVLSLLVGFAFVLPCTLVQRYAYKDNWLLALGKGMVLSLLLAIPTPLPSAITVALGVTGGIALRTRPARTNVIDIQN